MNKALDFALFQRVKLSRINIDSVSFCLYLLNGICYYKKAAVGLV